MMTCNMCDVPRKQDVDHVTRGGNNVVSGLVGFGVVWSRTGHVIILYYQDDLLVNSSKDSVGNSKLRNVCMTGE